jgi:uncharacterized protein YndB with AHSA1/START domain
MAAGLSAGAEPADRVLVITRVLDAPRSLVFKAWTDRDHLAHWFGPRNFELTFCKMDLRPGGSYRFGMHSAEGTDHWLQGTYQEIVEPEKLVCTYAWADANGNATRPETVLALTFAEQDGKTTMTLRQSVFESVTACDMHRQGWTSSLDRLAEFVTKA